MLYKRDYIILTDEESIQLEKAENYLAKHRVSGLTAFQLSKYHKLHPQPAYNFKSYFPNNYIYSGYNISNSTLDLGLSEFKELLQLDDIDERAILNFINKNKYYFILESIFFKYNFGHHDAYLFKEFELPPNYIVDYLLVGKNSSGYEFVFIEFEHPNKEITLADGSLGNSFRKGIKQVEDWDEWIDANFQNLKTMFKKYQNPNKNLPSEFYELDKTRIHYLVIAGKRKHFNEKTYRLKRKGINNIKILHYDNIIETTEWIVREKKKHNDFIG
jgi:hypothetical protein